MTPLARGSRPMTTAPGLQERTERGSEIQYVRRRHAAANDAAQANVRDAEGFMRSHIPTIAAEGG